MNIFSVLHCEICKIIRANVFWLVFLIFAFGPIMMGVGIILSSDAGGINWKMYLTELLDSLAPLGLIGYTFIAAWVFGREFSDKTIKDLLAKPVSRSKIVLSKFLVILAWSLLLSMYMFAIGFAVGGILGVAGGLASFVWNIFFKFIITSLLFIIVTTPGTLLANILGTIRTHPDNRHSLKCFGLFWIRPLFSVDHPVGISKHRVFKVE
ncbi:ABC transporter permease [Paenibacillus polymyxa]|uniref:ABC transporter permease n=1 Tax=Paenibacillus polymyxa TaxID=1406 RepID=UPI002AB5B470|nr:ABC transporter permease [Paenibacillus polymyxa]MDY8026233.1 ABC transporter permease [Paenibacillus polymyxa]